MFDVMGALLHRRRRAALADLRHLWATQPWHAEMAATRIDTYLASEAPARAEDAFCGLVVAATLAEPRMAPFVRAARHAAHPPWDALPAELKLGVARACPLPDVVHLSQVSHTWRRTLRSEPTLWRDKYPAGACHRPVGAGADWNRLALEQVAMARHLRAPRWLRRGAASAEQTIVAWQARGVETKYGAAGLTRLIEALAAGGQGAAAADFGHLLLGLHPRAEPLVRAARDGRYALATALVPVYRARGALQREGRRALRRALWDARCRTDWECVHLLVRSGISPETRDTLHGSTALMFAADQDNLASTEFLLSHGADVRAANLRNGAQPLDWALRRYAEGGPSQSHLVRALIAAGAPPDHRDLHHASTPLMFAAQDGDTELVHFLLDAGADPHARNPRNARAPLDWARRHYRGGGPHLQVVQALVAAGVPG